MVAEKVNPSVTRVVFLLHTPKGWVGVDPTNTAERGGADVAPFLARAEGALVLDLADVPREAAAAIVSSPPHPDASLPPGSKITAETGDVIVGGQKVGMVIAIHGRTTVSPDVWAEGWVNAFPEARRGTVAKGAIVWEDRGPRPTQAAALA